MKKIFINQSNYIPWKGYFDSIALCDVFVVYDDMQFTRQDWRNRNLILTPNGPKWLTIPVEMKGRLNKRINEIKVSDKNWNKKHLEFIKQNYRKSKNFKEIQPLIEEWYLKCESDWLSEINLYFIQKINFFLSIKTEIVSSSNFILDNERTQRLINICKELSATDYFSGPAAKNYLDEAKFKNENINVHFFDYGGYPEYNQLHSKFEHGVSILDLIFNTGNDAKKYLKYA
jgi:hypothetical protein